MIFSADIEQLNWSEVGRFRFEYGTKGANILALPKFWTPEFVLIPASYIDQIELSHALTRSWDDDLFSRIRKIAGVTNSSKGKSGLIVRSSVVGESIWDRGAYLSYTVDLNSDNFENELNVAAKKVIDSAQGEKVALLLQRYIEPKFGGEFGNLNRISKTRDHWEMSTTDSNGVVSVQRINSQRDRAADPERALRYLLGGSQERLFGSIGAWTNNELLLGRQRRLNYEWLMTEDEFFLLQIDEEGEDVQGINPFQVRIPETKTGNGTSGKFLRVADGEVIRSWDKLSVLDELWGAEEVQKPRLLILEVQSLLEVLRCNWRVSLESEFENLVGSSGIIVRTSGRASADKIPNLPRTEGLTPRNAVEWCSRTAEELTRKFRDKEFAFVIHRFIGANASAWVRAEPESPNVEIHALWGLPDALQFCPYDV